MTDPSQSQPFGYEGARRRAERVAGDTERTGEILDRASRKADRLRNRKRIRAVWHELTALFRLIRAWSRRQYREAPTKTIVAAIAAVIYFLSPIDLVPDIIPFFGFIDDVAVLGWVVRSIAGDLQRFREWEREGERVVDVQPDSVRTEGESEAP